MAFMGTLEGKGHVVRGVAMNAKGTEVSALFYMLRGAVVRDLVIDSTCVFAACESRTECVSAGLAAFAEDTVVVTNVTSGAEVTAQRAGGLIGSHKALEPGHALNVTGCHVAGRVHGTGGDAGGVVASVVLSNRSTVVFEHCACSEAANITGIDVAGCLVGSVVAENDLVLRAVACDNAAAVQTYHGMSITTAGGEK